MSSKRSEALISVSKKEFMDNFRSRWVLVLSFIFAGLILLIAAYEGMRPGGTGDFQSVVAFSSSLVVMLVSIVAIVMGYKSVVSEVESKSIALLLTSKLSRRDRIIAKFIGLTSVIAVSVVTGLGIGGLIIGLTSGFEGLGLYGIFILVSIMFGAAYLSISMLMSSFVSKKSRALAGGVFIWIFFNFIWDLLLFGILVGSGWKLPDSATEAMTYPDWYNVSKLFNPNYSFTVLVNKVIDPATQVSAVQIGSASYSLPEILTVPILVLALTAWILIPLLLGAIYFNKKDL